MEEIMNLKNPIDYAKAACETMIRMYPAKQQRFAENPGIWTTRENGCIPCSRRMGVKFCITIMRTLTIFSRVSCCTPYGMLQERTFTGLPWIR